MWSPVMGAICERSRWDSENVQERNFVETGSILLTSSTHTHIYMYMYICGLGQNSSLTVFNAEHVWVSIFEVQSPGVSNQMGQLVESWRAIMQAVLGISHEFP